MQPSTHWEPPIGSLAAADRTRRRRLGSTPTRKETLVLKRALLATAAVAALLAALPAAGLRRHAVDEDLERLRLEHHRARDRHPRDRPPSSRGSRTRARRPQDIVSDTFQTSPANDVANGVPGKAADGWAIGRSHAGARADAGRRTRRSPSAASTRPISADPLIGLIGATHNADGTWSAPTTIATGGGTAASGRACSSGGVPIFAGNGAGAISVLVNPTSPHRRCTTDLQAQLGHGTDGYVPKLARRLERSPLDRLVLERRRPYRALRAAARPDDGPADRHAALAPASDNIDNNSFGTALACAATCRLVYGDAPAGTSTNLLVSWWIGQAAPTTIANLANGPRPRAVSSPPPTAATGTSGSPGGTASRTATCSATRPAPAARCRTPAPPSTATAPTR